MSTLNRLANCDNRFQGDHKRVLCVCSAGLLRSPTAAVVLSRAPFNFNTRAAGASEEYALVPLDEVLLTWAQEIVCMELGHMVEVNNKLSLYDIERPIIVLDIVDNYAYRDDELMQLIAVRYQGEPK